jgi:small-conductance mechanosensitive channel
MQSTGRIVHIPNGWVFTDSIVNHTSSFAYIWHEIPVTVTFESDWRAAKATLLEIAHDCADHFSEDAARRLRRAAREYFIYYTTLTPTVYTSVLPHGVQLTIRYLVDPRRVRNSEESIWEAVLDAFVPRSDITLAYPTSRIFRASEETMHDGPLPHVESTHFEAPRGGGRPPPRDPLPESRGSGT